MKFNPNIHHRKSIRLKEYDYSQAGYYFVTICSLNREQLYGYIADGQMKFNEYGKVANTILLDLSKRFKYIEIDTHILMHNHLHAIIIINDPQFVGVELALPKAQKDNDRNAGVELALPSSDNMERKGRASSAPTDPTNENAKMCRAISAPTLGRIIQAFKSISTIEINKLRDVHGIPIWQRNYYEHIIRNEKELYKIRKYIENNPLNWNDDEYNE